ncbi:MAG: hypothetical protein Q4C84_12680 [Bacillota bacterium]|nr:hypothetical protein [Bacillota bacterium]
MKIAFVIWAVVGLIFMGIGIFDYFSEKAAGFWANAKTVPIGDVKKYNRAVGKLFICFGMIFILLGLPLLFSEQNSPVILLSVIGVMFEVIGTMIVYMKIETKYRRK